jgi:hypothetical protein
MLCLLKRAKPGSQWTLEMIETPRGVSGYLVHAEVISELGIFGYALFGEVEVVERVGL